MKEKDISERKKEHIELALGSQLSDWANDKRFYYEPLMGAHPDKASHSVSFFGKEMAFPLWVSSMTGGTKEALQINENLARACNEFGLGMGLGSCRPLLEDPKKYLKDFALREVIGKSQLLYANLGIAQLEKSIAKNELNKVEDMVGVLDADGLIIHINPLQEWIQPEGDRILQPPIQTIEHFIKKSDLPLIVKEVGQGMGPDSLRRLMALPVVIEFGAFGGTNFSQLEIARREDNENGGMGPLAHIGHNMEEMLLYFNKNKKEMKNVSCKGVILSGGMKSFLDGYYAISKLDHPAVYGQASALLSHARRSYESLAGFVQSQVDGYGIARELLRIR
ncbi:MAG: isopentenyl-diphosphate delta-isomerase [Vicingaceae bacterium]